MESNTTVRDIEHQIILVYLASHRANRSMPNRSMLDITVVCKFNSPYTHGGTKAIEDAAANPPIKSESELKT